MATNTALPANDRPPPPDVPDLRDGPAGAADPMRLLVATVILLAAGCGTRNPDVPGPKPSCPPGFTYAPAVCNAPIISRGVYVPSFRQAQCKPAAP